MSKKDLVIKNTTEAWSKRRVVVDKQHRIHLGKELTRNVESFTITVTPWGTIVLEPNAPTLIPTEELQEAFFKALENLDKKP